MAGTPTTYRGSDARIQFSGSKGMGTNSWYTWSVVGMGDFSLTLARGTVEQPLVGEIGNYRAAGTLSVEGSFTAAKLDTGAATDIAQCMVTGGRFAVSGNTGSQSLKFYFASCMVTGFDIKLGDADTVTVGTINWKVMDPQNVLVIPAGPEQTGTFIGDTGTG